MSNLSNNGTSLLEYIKNEKILQALRGKVIEDEPREVHHEYIKELRPKEKDNLIIYMSKDNWNLTKLYTREITLSVTLYQERSKLFPTIV